MRPYTARLLLGSSACLLAGMLMKNVVPHAVITGFFLGIACSLAAAVSCIKGC